MKFSTMIDEDLFNAMKQIAETCRTEANFIDEIRAGAFRFPSDPVARKRVVESHQSTLAKMQQNAEEVYAELMRRWEKFTDAA
jgi:hypothetical protein